MITHRNRKWLKQKKKKFFRTLLKKISDFSNVKLHTNNVNMFVRRKYRQAEVNIYIYEQMATAVLFFLKGRHSFFTYHYYLLSLLLALVTKKNPLID